MVSLVSSTNTTPSSQIPCWTRTKSNRRSPTTRGLRNYYPNTEMLWRFHTMYAQYFIEHCMRTQRLLSQHMTAQIVSLLINDYQKLPRCPTGNEISAQQFILNDMDQIVAFRCKSTKVKVEFPSNSILVTRDYFLFCETAKQSKSKQSKLVIVVTQESKTRSIFSFSQVKDKLME